MTFLQKTEGDIAFQSRSWHWSQQQQSANKDYKHQLSTTGVEDKQIIQITEIIISKTPIYHRDKNVKLALKGKHRVVTR